jgi:hypothetical protein
MALAPDAVDARHLHRRRARDGGSKRMAALTPAISCFKRIC